MSFRTLAIVAVVSLSTFQAASVQSGTRSHTRARAEAKITVGTSEAKPYEQTASRALMEVRLSETFTGDISGESPIPTENLAHESREPVWGAPRIYGELLMLGIEVAQSTVARYLWKSL
jgi:hypothetical protein